MRNRDKDKIEVMTFWRAQKRLAPMDVPGRGQLADFLVEETPEDESVEWHRRNAMVALEGTQVLAIWGAFAPIKAYAPMPESTLDDISRRMCDRTLQIHRVLYHRRQR